MPEPLRIMLATAFVASLATALIAGLLWAYNPDAGGGLAFLPDTVPLDLETATPEAEGETAEGETAEGEAGGEQAAARPTEPSPEPTPTEDPEEIIAAAAEPSATTVQVLDAGGGGEATRAAADVLSGDLGYNVISITSARANVERTTVWYTSGNEAEARALHARDPRFAETDANQGLNEGTDLHVLVGSDWGSADL